MHLIQWLVAGGLFGWVANWVMEAHDRHSILRDIAVSIAGAFLGGSLLDVLLGSSPSDRGDLGLTGLVVPLLSASVLLAILHLVRDAGAR